MHTIDQPIEYGVPKKNFRTLQRQVERMSRLPGIKQRVVIERLKGLLPQAAREEART